jgi:chromosomal replication initiator protein
VAKILQDIWEDVLAALRVSVSAERFNLWFRNTELLVQDDDSCEIGVPNAFVGEWLDEHFSEAVRGALGSITGKDLRVRFIVSPALYQKTREEELRQKQELVEAIDSTLSKKTHSEDATPRSFCLEEFVVGACNRLAHAASLHVASNSDLSLNPLVIHGAVGLGKTHLLRGICQRRNVSGHGRALYLSGESFTNQFLASLQHNSLDGFRRKFRDIELLALDDLQFIADKPATQEEFLQIYNFLMNLNKQVVLASDSHPKEVARLRETLMTRLVSGLIVRLDPPGYETRLAILRKKLGARCDFIGDDVLSFIAENISGNVRELEGAATTLIASAALAGEKIDLATAKRAVASLRPKGVTRVSAEDIEEAVAHTWRVKVEDIHSSRRHKSIALPRHVAMYLARELTEMSWKEIGEHFGGRNHTGALFAHKKIESCLREDPLLGETVQHLRSQLGS